MVATYNFGSVYSYVYILSLYNSNFPYFKIKSLVPMTLNQRDLTVFITYAQMPLINTC